MPRGRDAGGLIIMDILVLYPTVLAKGILWVLIVLVTIHVLTNQSAELDLTHLRVWFDHTIS